MIDVDVEVWSLELPQWWRNKHENERLQRLVADAGLWCLFPDPMSEEGKKILDTNELLFKLAEELEFEYSFEPSDDGRFILIPETILKQGFGITVGDEKDCLLVNLYFYPPDFSTASDNYYAQGPLLVASFSTVDMDEILIFARKYLPDETKDTSDKMAVIPLARDCIITLHGEFMDHCEETARICKDAVKGCSPEAENNADALIEFIRAYMENIPVKSERAAVKEIPLKAGRKTPTPGFTLGMRLAYLRKELGKTQKEMAEIAGVTPAAWARYEADHTIPIVPMMLGIGLNFNVNPEWMINNEGEIFFNN